MTDSQLENYIELMRIETKYVFLKKLYRRQLLEEGWEVTDEQVEEEVKKEIEYAIRNADRPSEVGTPGS
jgi:hypothetical protein